MILILLLYNYVFIATYCCNKRKLCLQGNVSKSILVLNCKWGCNVAVNKVTFSRLFPGLFAFTGSSRTNPSDSQISTEEIPTNCVSLFTAYFTGHLAEKSSWKKFFQRFDGRVNLMHFCILNNLGIWWNNKVAASLRMSMFPSHSLNSISAHGSPNKVYHLLT